MRINSNEQLFGQPILKIRQVVRLAMQERLFDKTKTTITKQVAEILQQPASVAKKTVEQLIIEGYVVFKKEKFGSGFLYSLTETEKGRRFGIATADPPITREKADLLLSELIKRAEAVNQHEELVYYVERLKVFGSYLSNKSTLGDLDIAFKLTRKKEGDEFMEMNGKRISLALKTGRRFSNYVDEICWPHREIVLMLKTKKKGLSLHDEESDEVAKRAEGKIAYEYSFNKSL